MFKVPKLTLPVPILVTGNSNSLVELPTVTETNSVALPMFSVLNVYGITTVSFSPILELAGYDELKVPLIATRLFISTDFCLTPLA